MLDHVKHIVYSLAWKYTRPRKASDTGFVLIAEILGEPFDGLIQ